MTAPAPIRGAVRTRKRPQPIDLSPAQIETEIPDRIQQFFDDDHEARSGDLDLRKQRYAKLMQYATEVDEPWVGASNVQLSDMMSAVLRSEDTTQNAVITTRPIANLRATNPANKDRERKGDLLLDHQLFVEQDGEALIEELSMNFYRDGEFTALTRWVREFRKIMIVRNFSAIPLDLEPADYFRSVLKKIYTAEDQSYREEEGSGGWDWKVTEGKTEYLASFYTEEDGEVTLQIEGDAPSFAGPKVCSYDYEDVLAPYWAQNLQPPTPSNPHGAPHVLLVDYPTKEEILQNVEAGFYDLVTIEQIRELDGKDWTDGDREMDRTRRFVRGVDPENPKPDDAAEEHQQLRRYLCFDVWKGLDVVWTMVMAGSTKLLVRARPLTEISPGLPLRRPLAHACMIRVQGTWRGMGLPELMENMHDYMGERFNMMNHASMLEIFPFFKYRASSTIKPEDLQLGPLDGIPCTDVDRDLKFERANPQATAICINQIGLAQRYQEDLTLLGDLQAGRIPAGRSAALRTSGGIQQVLAQGEARPARLLRRFFKGLLEIHADMYRLNRHFLEDRKKFRVIGIPQANEDPFIEIDRIEDLQDAHFDFEANILNSSKVALQSGLSEALNILVNPLMMQLGITTPPGAYRLIASYIEALGLNPKHFIQEPAPGAQDPPILAEEAVTAILNGSVPRGTPAEGDPRAHLQRLQEILSEPDEMGLTPLDRFSDAQKQSLGLWMQDLQSQMQAAQERARLMQAAQQFAAARQQRNPNPSGASEGNPNQPTISGPNETLDESLPRGTGTPQ